MSDIESFNLLNRIIDNSLDAASKLEISFYHNNINRLMIDQRFDSCMKYTIGLEIIDTYFDLKKSLMRHKDSIIVYRYKSESPGTDFTENIKKMIHYQYSIGKYLDELAECIKEFDIAGYLDDKNTKNNKYIDLRDEQRLEIFEEVLTRLENFENFQLNFFNSEKFDLLRTHFYKGLSYQDIFEKMLTRYIERVKWARIETLKIKYAKHIGIEYSLSEATENINNIIREYNRIDKNYF